MPFQGVGIVFPSEPRALPWADLFWPLRGKCPDNATIGERGGVGPTVIRSPTAPDGLTRGWGKKIEGRKMNYRIMNAPASVVVLRPEGAAT